MGQIALSLVANSDSSGRHPADRMASSEAVKDMEPKKLSGNTKRDLKEAGPTKPSQRLNEDRFSVFKDDTQIKELEKAFQNPDKPLGKANTDRPADDRPDDRGSRAGYPRGSDVFDRVGDEIGFTYSRRPARQGIPVRRKRERSISLDKDLFQELVRISNAEGLRLNARISVAEIIRHLLEYSIAQVEDGEVIPTPDGRGLRIPNARAR